MNMKILPIKYSTFYCYLIKRNRKTIPPRFCYGVIIGCNISTFFFFFFLTLVSVIAFRFFIQLHYANVCM